MRRLLLTAGFCGALVLPTTPASANFGSIPCGYSATGVRNCVNLANNQYHSFHFEVLGNQIPNIDTDTQWAITNAYDGPTDLVAYRDETDPYPDVIVADADYGDNLFDAWDECPTNNTGTGGTDPTKWCRGQKIRYNAYYYYTGPDFDTAGNRQRLACHEIGHTVGLRHFNDYHTGTGSCLFNPAVSASTNRLSAHEITDHINPWY